MRILKPFLMVLIFSFALLFGLFYHISSSEFWPITISKTIWSLQLQESSVWQKPVFNFALSLFHFIPGLNDVEHLQLVKVVFTLLGFVSILLFTSSVRRLVTESTSAEVRLQDYVISAILLLVSPFYLNNFFRIRSDQFTFFVLSLALYFLTTRKMKSAYLTLLTSVFVSLKSVVLILPLMILVDTKSLLLPFQMGQRTKWYFYGLLAALAIWFIALNLPALTYVFTSIGHPIDFVFLNTYLMAEAPLILGSLGLGMYFSLSVNMNKFIKLNFASRLLKTSLVSLILILFSPQSLPFFIGSLVPFIYLPLMAGGYVCFQKSELKLRAISVGLVSVLILISVHAYWFNEQKIPFFRANLDQFEYIKKSAKILERNKLTYLDGMGLYPRQNYLSCFYSPNDDDSNLNCLNQIKEHKADVYILTRRLSSLNEDLVGYLKDSYIMVQPNFWIKTASRDRVSDDEFDPDNGPVPALIFGM